MHGIAGTNREIEMVERLVYLAIAAVVGGLIGGILFFKFLAGAGVGIGICTLFLLADEWDARH